MRKLILVGGLVLGIVNPAHSADLPPIKPGLWEVETTSDGVSIGTIRQCVDDASAKEMMKLGQQFMGGACSPTKTSQSKGKFLSTMTCQIAGSTMTTNSELSGDFNKEYSMVTNTRFDPPMMGQSSSKTVARAVFKGDCGPDMKPGDIIGPDGQKRNALSAMRELPDMDEMMKQMEQHLKNMPQGNTQ